MNASLTVSAALLVFQFCFGAILAVGVWIISRGYNPEHGIRIQRAKNPTSLLFLIIAVTFATIGPILVTSALAVTWAPAYGASIHGGLSIDGVRSWVFALDIVMVSLIISKTGGWKASPFPALNFSLPAIAILLGDSGLKVAIYTASVAFLYGASLAHSRGGRVGEARGEDDLALWVVTILALALTTTIGVLTRHA